MLVSVEPAVSVRMPESARVSVPLPRVVTCSVCLSVDRSNDTIDPGYILRQHPHNNNNKQSTKESINSSTSFIAGKKNYLHFINFALSNIPPLSILLCLLISTLPIPICQLSQFQSRESRFPFRLPHLGPSPSSPQLDPSRVPR